ncbi:PREDICTED: B3 domain-containing protein At1g05920-like [Tarenaya hassleriana]|uniref:B3 domain-containing protein At1g05920-like n=1 Tax=Tarenaya hassleriana TaxID=28532 RepID=UPI00053C29C2|nr:PREDICTED: B3 domain-containing protein At1g05920-like [Tarenaya hassleriana]
MWSNLFLLAEVASSEYDRLHCDLSEAKAAIEGPVDEPRQDTALLLDPLVSVPTRKRSPSFVRRPSQKLPLRFSSSSLAECKRRMKRPLLESEEEKQSTQLKKRKKYDSGSTSKSPVPPREAPLWLLNVMREMNGYAPKLVIEKNLFKSDINRNLGRLAIPTNHVVEKDFLTATEERMIDEKCRLKTSDVDVVAVLVDPLHRKWNVVLRRWDMAKDSGNCSSIFVFVSTWNSIVDANGFKEGDPIELWSFRSQGRLCFAFVPPRRSSLCSGQCSSAL